LISILKVDEKAVFVTFHSRSILVFTTPAGISALDAAEEHNLPVFAPIIKADKSVAVHVFALLVAAKVDK
jgi:hypothetical protein